MFYTAWNCVKLFMDYICSTKRGINKIVPRKPGLTPRKYKS
jgi:hypothetical protein